MSEGAQTPGTRVVNGRTVPEAGTWEIDVAGTKVGARPSLAPLYDPKRERILA